MSKTPNKNSAKRSSAFSSSYFTSSATSSSTVFSPAFTIVELLVVIVIIGILATITIISYGNVTNKATIAELQSDLSSASKQLKSYLATNDVYPTTIDCSGSNTSLSTNLCLKTSSGETFTYQVDNNNSPVTFSLYVKKNNLIYRITSDSQILATTIVCPINFIVVPGSTTYGTSDFCVMKYEAKIYNNNNGIAGYSTTNYPNSRASGTPYVNISQTNAITQAAKTVDGRGNTIANTHLITEAEWMTIAQNVLSVASNWSSGTVGTGYIYSGHNDNSPATALEASTDDGNGYANTGNSSSSGANQKRTLTLTNGEVIWDLSGNVWDWTSGTISSGQPGVSGGGYAWRQYTAITTTGSLAVNIFPSSTGISGASSWTSSNGIGQIYSSADETAARAFLRGGIWGNGGYAGVLTLNLNGSPSRTSTDVGFRVSSSSL